MRFIALVACALFPYAFTPVHAANLILDGGHSSVTEIDVRHVDAAA